MKTLLISLIFICASVSLFAQADTSNTMNTPTYNNNNNPVVADTSGATNNPNTDTSGNRNNNMNMNNMNMNNMNMNNNKMNHNNKGAKMDTSSNMNNSNNPSTVPPSASTNTYSTSNSAMNIGNNQNGFTQNSTAAASQNASLPVLETYVPQNIVDQAKQKYSGGQIYDMTAVRSPEDTMTQNASGMNAWSSSTKNAADRDDSSMNQNSAMNSTSQNQHSTINSGSQDPNGATANKNNTHTMDMAATATAPHKFDYVVRVMQAGQMQTEKLKIDGTALVVRTTSPDASLTNQ